MAQLDPSRYKRLTKPYEYASSDGLYWDTTNSRLVVSVAGTVYEAPLQVASQARGDILRRGASTWERLDANDSGKVLVGDGTDVTSGGLPDLDNNLVRYAVVDLTAPEITGLNTIGIVVAPAPAASEVHILSSAAFFLDYGGAAFGAVGANDNLVIRYQNASGTVASGSATGVGMLDQATDQVRYVLPIACTPVLGQPLVVAFTDAADGLTKGLATSTLRVLAAYRTHTLYTP